MSLHPATASLLALYRDPFLGLQLSLAQWTEVLGAMRRCRTMGPVAVRLELSGVMAGLPDPVRAQFDTARVNALDRRHRLRWELAELGRALAPCSGSVLVLKGAAYELQSLPMARGRTPADIDLLVEPARLSQAEALLKAAGWRAQALDPYDERYYRDWSHEVPPLVHPARNLEVDLHHAITPALRGPGVDTARLVAASRPCGAFRVLAPEDQLIHCAIHTFKDSDLDGRLREVMDFDHLLRAFAGDDGVAFSRAVHARARTLGEDAHQALALAARTARRWLGTPMPAIEGDQTRGASGDDRLGDRLLDRLMDASMLPGARQPAPGMANQMARQLLLARYHLKRMPITRLLPHLLEKSRRRFLFRSPAAPSPPTPCPPAMPATDRPRWWQAPR